MIIVIGKFYNRKCLFLNKTLGTYSIAIFVLSMSNMQLQYLKFLELK